MSGAEAERIAARLTYRCDKCSTEWIGNATGKCPKCGIGIDIGNALCRPRSDRGTT